MRESLGMLQLVKSYLMDRFNQNRVERQLTDYARAEWRRLRGHALSAPLLTAAVLLAAVALLYVGGRAVLAGELSLAGLALQAAALAALIGPVRAWVGNRVRVRKAGDAASDVAEFLDRRGDAGQPIDAEFLHPMTRKLDFVDVSFREPGTGRMVLENVTLSIPTGTRVAVVGSDQTEVHSLAFLLTRFLDPTAGEVRIDGKNLRWVTHESLRTQVALVMQQQLVFNDTVANNIGCGDPGFSVPQIIEAAKVAHAHQFVHRLPYGYETMIGDAGHALRSGEKLRVALARAILRDPSLIVVEEPEGPLDHDTKALLDDTFERLRAGRTLVILSRRQSVLRSADQVFVLHHGRLAASGTHAELMQSSELYRNLLFQEIAVAGVPG
jgi:ABC-type multidrug transport system fused ATPase/permease subunit